MFDLVHLEQASGLSPAVLKQVEQKVKEDSHDDEMLFELHLVRIFHALKEGRLTVDQVLREYATA
jgi:hypothetical protein